MKRRRWTRHVPRLSRWTGPPAREIANIARRHRIKLVAGVMDLEEPDRAYNPLVAYGPEVGRLTVYRKMGPFRRRRVRGVHIHQAGPVHESGGGRARGNAVRADDLSRRAPLVPSCVRKPS